jgi:ketosteroid isomerase-like protein
MTTKEIADRLVSLCRESRNLDAIDELYADDILSLEANEPMREVKGIEGVRGKSAWWIENHEVHGGSVEGPFVNGDQFVVRFKFDITPKATGERVQMDEVGLYEVKDGKIVQETFLY